MKQDIKVLLGKKIKEYRKRKGLTQEQLAEAIEIDTVTVSKIETGKNYPTSTNLTKIADILSVHPKDLYDFEIGKTKQDITSEIINKIYKISENEKKLNLIYNIVNAIE